MKRIRAGIWNLHGFFYSVGSVFNKSARSLFPAEWLAISINIKHKRPSGSRIT